MRKSEIQIDGVYTAKVSSKIAHVRIDRECQYGGWYATNLATKREIHIRTAQRLRQRVQHRDSGEASR